MSESTDAQIRSRYAMVAYTHAGVDRRLADFDCWLAEHDRLVAERAWDEGFDSGHYMSADESRDCDCRDNPYRNEQENNDA